MTLIGPIPTLTNPINGSLFGIQGSNNTDPGEAWGYYQNLKESDLSSLSLTIEPVNPETVFDMYFKFQMSIIQQENIATIDPTINYLCFASFQ
jgi:hypothetical protein